MSGTRSAGTERTRNVHPFRWGAGVSPRAAAWLSWSLCLLSGALTALAVLLLILNRSHPNVHIFDYGAMLTVSAIAAAPVGAVISSRRPETPVGWIICALGLNSAVEHFSSQYAIYALRAEPGSLPGGEAMAWISSWFWAPGTCLLVFLLLLFPNGRLPSRRWRWFAWFSVAVLVASILSSALMSGPVIWLGSIQNPFGIEGAQSLLGSVVSVSTTLENGILALVAAVSLFLRLRWTRGEEREQIKWFAYAGAVMAGSFVLTYVVSAEIGVRWVFWASFAVLIVGVFGLATAIGVAVLKYRLYEIDLIINRSLVYLILTASLVLVYLGCVALLQFAFRSLTGEGSQLAVVASTLVIAALFNPFRKRIQTVIDRRFYRRKYDAQKTLEAFSRRLRDEVDLESLTTEMLSVVEDTLQPEHASLWLCNPDRHEARQSLGRGNRGER